MFSLEEMTTWTADDAEAAVRKLLPAGWALSLKLQDRWFGAEILNTEGVEEWSDWHADRRILLLNAFGWLSLRHQRAHHPAWRPRTEVKPDLSRAHRAPPIADPEDLDPQEIRRVHSQHRDKS